MIPWGLQGPWCIHGSQFGWGMDGPNAYGHILLSFYFSFFYALSKCIIVIPSMILIAQVWCLQEFSPGFLDHPHTPTSQKCI